MTVKSLKTDLEKNALELDKNELKLTYQLFHVDKFKKVLWSLNCKSFSGVHQNIVSEKKKIRNILGSQNQLVTYYMV